MKERGILFSARMVRALLARRKTQTRRVVNQQPGSGVVPYKTSIGSWNWVLPETGHGTQDPFVCPYGTPGDRLWVRETWGWIGDHRHCDQRSIYYRADRDDWLPGQAWRPSIFMPRWASRATLATESVRVERLQEITFGDVRAEGVECPTHDFESGFCSSPCGDLRDAWINGWDRINGKRAPWASNPWVWVVCFRVIS